jgi:hypothetical protein
MFGLVPQRLTLILLGARSKLITAGPRTQGLATIVALSLSAIVILLAIEGHIAVAVLGVAPGVLALWLVGMSLPGEAGGYPQKMARIMQDTRLSSISLHDSSVRKIRRSTRTIARHGQDSLRDTCPDLVVDCRAVDDVVSSSGIGFDQVNLVIEHRHALLACAERLESDGLNRRLVGDLTERASLFMALFESSQQLLDGMAQRLRKLRPPSVLAAQHEQYIEILTAYVTVYAGACERLATQSGEHVDEDLLLDFRLRHEAWRTCTGVYLEQLRRAWNASRRVPASRVS